MSLIRAESCVENVRLVFHVKVILAGSDIVKLLLSKCILSGQWNWIS